MDIVLEMQKNYWLNFNDELYKRYLKAKIEQIQLNNNK